MNAWGVIWFVFIMFSVVSFAVMSLKVIYRGLPELLEMFHSLDE
jgi:hypothetical protein